MYNIQIISKCLWFYFITYTETKFSLKRLDNIQPADLAIMYTFMFIELTRAQVIYVWITYFDTFLNK